MSGRMQISVWLNKFEIKEFSQVTQMKKIKSYITVFLLLIFSFIVNAQKDNIPSKLETDTILLNEIVVSETLPFNNKQVEKFYRTNSISTIDYVIERLDGMSLIRRGSYAMEPMLNGFSGGQLNITIDGMKMFGACTDRMDPITSYIEPTNLKSITIHQGSNGCQTGCNIGGSVDMALQEPQILPDQLFYTSFSPGYESISNGKTLLFSTGLGKNRWQWGLNSAYRKNDSYKDGDRNTVPFTQYEKTNIHSVLKFLPDSSHSFKADILFDLARNVGYAALPMDVGKARAYLIALEYRRARRSNLTAKIYFNSILHIMDDSKRDSAYYVTNKLSGQKELVYMRMDMPGTSSTFGAYIKSDFELNKKNRLTVQADNYSNRSLAEMTMYMHYPGIPPEAPMYLQTWPELFRNVTGLFLQNIWKISGKITLNLNGRLDYSISRQLSDLAKEQFSVFNINLSKNYQKLTKSFNLSAQYFISRASSLNFETGYSERLPTIGEQFGFYLYNAYDGYDYIGNPDIKSEKSVSSRVAILYSKPRFKINLSQSFNYIHDYIMGKTDTTIPPMNFYTNGTRVYTNVSGAKLYSANLQVQFIPFSAVSVFLLTKYTWGQLNSGDTLPMIDPLNNVLAISFQKTRWNINLENETAMAQNRINTNYGEIRSASYSIFNIKGSYHFMFIKPIMFDCSLGITNFFNAKYYKHLDWGQIYRPGTSLDIFLGFSF